MNTSVKSPRTAFRAFRETRLPNARTDGLRTRIRPRRLTGRELALACGSCMVVCGAILGPHVVGGGRYLDDWWISLYTHFPHQLGFSSAYSYLTWDSGARPGAVTWWLLTYWLFGQHFLLHRTLALLLAAGLAAIFYALLRELGLARLDAAAIVGLSLAVPVADAIHFWVTPDVAQLCLAACAAGFLFAVKGFRAQGRRATIYHAAASCLYLVSVLIAETTIPFVGLSLLVYRTQVSWRRAVRRWLPDLLLVALAAAHYLTTGGERAGGGGLGAYIHHARVLGDQGLTLLAGTVFPFTHSRGWVLVVLAALALWFVLVARRTRWRSRAAASGMWLAAAALAFVLAAASYAVYVPSNSTFQPVVAQAIGNRINVGAVLPLAVLVYAVARLVGGLASSRVVAGALTAVVWGVALAGGLIRLEADRALWDRAAAQQKHVLAALHKALPDPRSGAALIVFGSPGVVTHTERVGVVSVNESVPVFSTWWELDAAVKLSYNRADINAYPVWAFQPPQLACGAVGVYQFGLDGVRHLLFYGDVYVVEVAGATATPLRNREQCDRVVTGATTIRYDLPA